MGVSSGTARGRDDVVGRQRELGVLATVLHDAADGRGRLLLITGEPGIGKTRLAQELSGQALASGYTVAWGRCVASEGAPAYWPWQQVLRSLNVHADTIDTSAAESPEERFRLYDAVRAALVDAASRGAVVVVLDDIHWADEPSLLLLRHLATGLFDVPILVVATLRGVEPAPALQRVLPDLTRSPAAERLDLRGLTVEAVREQLTRAVDDQTASTHASRVTEATGGNPFFVREVARALADGSWRDDRPPRSVLDVVTARLNQIGADCRHLVQAAAVVGRDFSLPLVSAVVDRAPSDCLPLVDEAIGYGLVDHIEGGDYRFVHALTRDAVEASLDTQQRLDLHRTVAGAIEQTYASDLSDHLTDLARHWAQLAPYGDAATARDWAIRAGDEAVRRLAYEEGVRLYQAALSYNAALGDGDRCNVLLALANAAYFAGDHRTWVESALGAAAAARQAGDVELLAESALVLEAVPDTTVNVEVADLSTQALAALRDDDRHRALRARLLALQSHVAFYAGDIAETVALSRTALDEARASGDDRALVEALRARQEALPGPAGRPERTTLTVDMIEAARRLGSPRSEMWGRLWRVEVLAESGQFTAAADALPELARAAERVGGPVSGWHVDRTTACIAQAHGRYDEALATARRGFERMFPIEPAPASGAFFSLNSAVARHLGPPDDIVAMALSAWPSVPRFMTMGRLSRAYVLLLAEHIDEAASEYQEAGRVGTWDLPVFFVIAGHTLGVSITTALGRPDDVAALLGVLDEYRGEHVIGNAVSYHGPVELALGIGAMSLGRYDDAVTDLTTAVDLAADAGAPGFTAEARFHLAKALRDRKQPGDRDAALVAARDSDRGARTLGMTAFVDRTAALVAELEGASVTTSPLSAREAEVAALVGEGLTNKQIAERLVISERTAQNHVQHILTKLGFTTRSQIAAWVARAE